MPDERPSASLTLVAGVQHVAMFSLTAIAPLLMGFDPNVSILFSGSATLMIRSWAGRCPAISVQALRSLVPCSPQQARSRAAIGGLVLALVAIDSASRCGTR